MLSVITGKQRSGKSFYCVTLIVEYLKQYRDRAIFTNLPLNPDKLCRVAAGRDNVRYGAYLRRIHLFKSFRTFREARKFYLNNPDWSSLHLCISEEKIREFWLYTKPNSVIMLDEIYQWFSAAMYKEEGAAERRRQLLAYSRQHGHYKDDMFLISHKLCDVDKHIRDGTQYFYIVRNSKYTNVFKWRWARGFKWPYQFFIVEGFEDGDTELSDSWKVFPDKRIFECYNSFSAAETIPGKTLPANDADSTDTGVNFWWNFKRFVAQCWIGLAILGGLVVGGFMAYRVIYGLGHVSSDDVPSMFGNEKKHTSSCFNKGSESSKPAGGPESGSVPLQRPQERQQVSTRWAGVRSLMPNMIIFEDNYIIRVGGNHEGFTVVSICRDFVELEKDGQVFKVRPTGVHELPFDYERRSSRSNVSNVGYSGNFSGSGQSDLSDRQAGSRSVQSSASAVSSASALNRLGAATSAYVSR